MSFSTYWMVLILMLNAIPLNITESKSEFNANDFCNTPPDPQKTFDKRFLPDTSDPKKLLKINFVFLGRQGNSEKGIEASDERSADYQAYIDEVIRIMNFQMGNFLHEQIDNQCSDVRIDSKIRFDIKKLFIKNNYYWNNENDDCRKGCPSIKGCDWYINELSDSLNRGLSDTQKRINIFFSENEGYYDEVLKGRLDDASKILTDCSMGYKTDFNIDAKIHMRNELIAFKNCYWVSKEDKIEYKTALKWAHWGTARLIIHEIGHTIFGGGHVNNKCNIMDGGENYVQEHLRDQQLQEAHRALSTHNMRKYVKIPKQLSHPIIIANNEVWDYDIQLWGDLIVEPNSVLTVSCKLRMPPLSRIILKKGAKLIIDGGSVIPAYDRTSWYGVEGAVQRTGFFSRLFNKKSVVEGGLEVINDGIISLN